MTNKLNRRNFIIGSGALGAGSLVMPNLSQAKVLPNPDPKAVVETESGKVRGAIADGVSIFRGIPYGDDTGGDNRFKPPKPAKKWSGVRDVLDYGNMAPQAGGAPANAGMQTGARITRSLFAPLTSQAQSEDCLYLNVWSSGVNQSPNRAVMVWLHGGGFTSGSGASTLYDGINLAKRDDVVVVTVNHRLGALGYCHLAEIGGSDYERAGMAGMLDLVHALKWVRDNIAAFGGDPNRVMIFGESGGGRKVSTLLGMPGAKGLFHSAVVHSGPGLRFTSTETANKRAHQLMRELGLGANQFDQLKKLPFATIMAAQGAADRKVSASLPPGTSFFERYGWAPVLGPDLPHWPFDPTGPDESLDVPVIVGCNRFEMALFISPNKRLDVIDEETLQNQVKGFAGEHADDLISSYRKSHPNEDLRSILLLIMSDDRYRVDSIKLAERKYQRLAENSQAAPVYMYRFDWETPVWDGLLRAPHALEIPFVFANAQLSSAFTGGGPDAVALSAVMSETWATFAKTGNPNNNKLSEWKPYTTQTRDTLLFNDRSQLVSDPDSNDRLAWSKIR